MMGSTFLRRLFIPSSGFIVYAKGKEDGGKPPECEKLVRANDMPLYSEYNPPSQQKKKEEEVNDNSVLVTTIRCMREELCVFMEQVDVVKKQLSDVYLTGKAHTQSTIEYLREPDNTYPRIGALTVGALTGYLLALRKGKFKKLMYMGAGSGAMTAVIYPKETQEYAEEAHAYFKRYIIIAYHFLNGVSRDLTGWELPALPNGAHLNVTEGHHKDAADSVPEPSHLLPPTAGAVHLHLHPDPEVKK